jgi:hypothetical protein
LFKAIQRQVIHVFADQHPGQQTYGGQAAVDDRWRDGRGGDRFETAARILWADMPYRWGAQVPVDKELGRFDIQLSGNVVADLD